MVYNGFMLNELLIMKPFNIAFFVLLIFGFILLWIITKVLNGAKEGPKRTTYVIICILTIIGYFAYKYTLSLDAEYNVAYAAYGGFNWWQELPLHLCNVHMLLMPIAVLTKKRPLLGFCFFVAPLGALMALVMPGPGFSGYSILLPRMIGYYMTHLMVIIEAILLYTLDYYRPEYRDFPSTCGTLIAVSIVIFGIDLALKYSKLCTNPNYFYLLDTEGNPVLEIFYRLIPYPYLYTLPCLLILAVYILVITFIVKRIESLHR